MSTMIKWNKNSIEVEPPKKPKKITGTRLASIFGLNKWNTPFQTWCEITRTYEPPFEDTIYTIAGKVIEPKQNQFIKDSYCMNTLSPTEVYGDNYFKKTWGDFFHENKIFGGMWDYLQVDKNGKTTGVLEMKTTKRVEDWSNDIPEYYALQASLYAYLLGVDDVYMVATFLEDKDYENPNTFECTYDNTIVRHFKVSERYPYFEEYIKQATAFYEKYVKRGISPTFDEKKDKEYLDALRTMPSADTGVDELINKANELSDKINSIRTESKLSELEAEYEELKKIIREELTKQLTGENKKSIIDTDKYVWSVAKSVTKSIDTDKLQEDGLYDSYVTEKESIRLTVKEKKL